MSVDAVPNEDELQTVIRAICRLPLEFRAGNMSPVQLVRRSGYRKVRRLLRPEALVPALAAHPEWIEAWFHWSADKRTSSGWYLEEAGGRAIEVGYFPPTPALPTVTFSDRSRATATFIVHELDNLSSPLSRRVAAAVHDRLARLRRRR